MSKVANHDENDDAYHRYDPEPIEDNFEGGANS